MAVRKSAAKKRLLSVSQQFVLEKVKRAFDGERARVSEARELIETRRHVESRA